MTRVCFAILVEVNDLEYDEKGSAGDENGTKHGQDKEWQGKK